MSTFACPLPPFDAPILQAALTRISYLHPAWTIEKTPESLLVTTDRPDDEGAVRKEVTYAIYREKILHETMDMRRDLLQMVMSK